MWERTSSTGDMAVPWTAALPCGVARSSRQSGAEGRLTRAEAFFMSALRWCVCFHSPPGCPVLHPGGPPPRACARATRSRAPPPRCPAAASQSPSALHPQRCSACAMAGGESPLWSPSFPPLAIRRSQTGRRAAWAPRMTHWGRVSLDAARGRRWLHERRFGEHEGRACASEDPALTRMLRLRLASPGDGLVCSRSRVNESLEGLGRGGGGGGSGGGGWFSSLADCRREGVSFSRRRALRSGGCRDVGRH